MLALGYIRQSPEDKRYSIGRPIFCLAATALDEIALTNIATGVLNQLSLSTGETSHFAIWSGREAIILAKCDGMGAFQLSDRVGGARPAHATALGKILLSGLDPKQLERYLAHANLVRFTQRTITDPQRIRAEIQAVARSELASDDAEFLEEVRCIAVPVRNFENQLVGALGLSGPIWRLSLQAIQQHAGQLRAAAKQLSAELGEGGLPGRTDSALPRAQRSAPLSGPVKRASRS
jgi:DNA-binding IclR family transcriptional regulator